MPGETLQIGAVVIGQADWYHAFTRQSKIYIIFSHRTNTKNFESFAQASWTMTIRLLPEEVVNKIAAGEVLVRPSNAVKELVENSVDAGAGNITITLGNGGLQTIQIVDDGKGIPMEDHPLVCRRFATSKLSSANELCDGKIQSFGFRGEALASMSLVGHVSVFSKAKADGVSHGFESRYLSGALLPNFPVRVPFAGVSGTRIVVDDLFFSNPVRKQAFKSPSSEYKRILDVVAKFAIVFPHIAFTVRKAGDLQCGLMEESCDDRLKRIESLMDVDRRDLIRIQSEADCPHPLLSFECIVSNPNAAVSSKNSPATSSVVAINGRLLEHCGLVKLVESEMLAQFQTRPKFVFIALELDPKNLDINVCPTKGKVIFSNQSLIERFVVDQVLSSLLESRKVKVIKLNKLHFAPVKLVQTVVEEIKVESSQPFKIHTCAKQNFFRPFTQDSSFLELTQVVDRDVEQPPADNTATDLQLNCQEKLSTEGEMEMANPRDFVFVGHVGDNFVVCQQNSRLCICNIAFAFIQVVRRYLLTTGLRFIPVAPIEVNMLGLPDWVCDLFEFDGHAVSFFPSVGPSPPCYTSSAIQTLIGDLSALEVSEMTPSSVGAVSEVCARWLFDHEFHCDARRIWDEVLRNKKYVPTPERDNLIEPLNVEKSRNFFFREIISLKELYKDFERC